MCMFVSGCILLPSTITHLQSELIYYRIKLFTSAKRIPSIIVIAKIYQNSSPLQSRLGMTSNLSSHFLWIVSNKKSLSLSFQPIPIIRICMKLIRIENVYFLWKFHDMFFNTQNWIKVYGKAISMLYRKV